MTRVGVVTGLAAEARIAGRAAARHRSHPSIACANARSAGAAAARLVEQGADALISFGIAGGLAADLRPGALVCADRVIGPDGAAAPTDAAWRHRVLRDAAAGGIAMVTGAVAGSDSVLATAGDKRALADATGALTVDMESHHVAAAALAARIPWMALRAIADPAHRTLPAAAVAALRDDGGIDVAAVVGRLCRRPWQLPALIGLAVETRLGLGALRRAARLRVVFCGPW
ncbi:MAG: hypothetical protein V3R98_05855 [Alphaproteobacteria bacterium]